MRRYDPPYNGKRYLLNKNTGEIHDLDCESVNCQINEIDPKHVQNVETYQEALLAATFLTQASPNGCFYCNPTLNTD